MHWFIDDNTKTSGEYHQHKHITWICRWHLCVWIVLLIYIDTLFSKNNYNCTIIINVSYNMCFLSTRPTCLKGCQNDRLSTTHSQNNGSPLRRHNPNTSHPGEKAALIYRWQNKTSGESHQHQQITLIFILSVCLNRAIFITIDT